MSAPLLRVAGLRCRLGGRDVVADVSFSVEAGQVVGLLGPNGAGKTTCFRVIAGLLDASAGTVALDGVDLGRRPLWRRVRAGLGYLPQQPSVFRGLTVRDNVCLAEEAGSGPGQADALLSELGLAPLADARAGTLSGGERRRLEIARCLATRPRLMLLDEPFAGVDPVAVAELQGRLRALAARRGLGVLVTDHAVHATLPICDRAVILDGGRILAEGTPARVAAREAVRARYLGPGFSLPES